MAFTRRPCFPQQLGFTLVEVIFVLLISSILTVMTWFSLSRWLQQAKAEQVLWQLYTVINYARVEAFKRGRPVIICPRDGKFNCGKDWSEGYIVFVGVDNHLQQRQILRIYPATGGRLSWHGFAQARHYLKFTPGGFVNTRAETKDGHFQYCGRLQPAGTHAMQLILSQNGRVRFAAADDPTIDCDA